METAKNIEYAKYALCIGLIVFSAANLVMLSSANSYLDSRANFAAEKYKPDNLNITLLTVAECDDCFKTDDILNKLTQSNVKVSDTKSFDIYSTDGRKLINEYEIDKAPTFVLQGDVNQTNIRIMLNGLGKLINNNTFVYTKPTPVFLDLKSGSFVGRVNVTLIIDSSCSECIDLSLAVKNINKSGVSIKNEDILNLSDEKSKVLIEKYNISVAPTLIFSNSILAYNDLQSALIQIGTIEQDGSFVLRSINPPYRNLSTNQIIGRTEMINIIDSACSNCYNVSINKQIVQNGYGIFISNEITYDIKSSKGIELLNKYNISKVPTFLLSPQAESYANLMGIWNSVGTFEKDGWLVFRNIEAIKDAVYKDLSTNQTIGV